MKRIMKMLVMGCGILASSIGCSRLSPPPAKEEPAKAKPALDAHAEADKIFLTRCASCHGLDGRGDGPGAANLNPKPRNYHDKTWQKTITDEQIEKTIVYGGAAVGKSPSMAANPDLTTKPEVVAALREYIRKLGKE